MKNITLRKLLEQYPDDIEIGVGTPDADHKVTILYYRKNLKLKEMNNKIEHTLYIVVPRDC